MTISEEEARFQASVPRQPFETGAAGRAYLAAEEEKRRKRGEPHGLSGAQVAAADAGGMALETYAAMGSAKSVDDYRRARADERERAEARAEAARQLRVEAYLRELRS